jgi:hypothetical protein
MRRRRWIVMMIWNILRDAIDNMILEFSRDYYT